ncbi:response regulator [Cellulomonas sp. S1-8]|uniref:response regulator n=1 Tax=Cellulomonas sp. S1-8 TaxID=2904790 RepID=UPI002242FAC6|nr:response regulator transcription factor [Cellulomonas sp. S1-8]UZN03700.1 response regulator transcription factor [Cellulomonas sp. S1-8]
MIRVVVVDDDALVRGGIRMILESTDDVVVVGEAADGRAGVALIRAERPDVALLDVRMPVLDGIEATAQVTAEVPQTRVVIVTTFEHDEYVFDALRAGAAGFLLKRTTPEDLIAAVRVVAAGDALLSPSVTRRLIAEFARPAPAARPAAEVAAVGALTEREREVLVALAAGWSNAELASRLFISEETVRTHVKRVLHKLDLRDRAQVVVFAYETGLVVPGGATPDGPGRTPRSVRD